MNILRKITGVAVLCLLAMTANAQSTDTFDLDETYRIDSNGTISLNSDDADVRIVGSDRSDVHVEVRYRLEVSGFSFGSRTEFGMTVREDNGNLVIEEQPRDFSGVTFGSSREEYSIRIEAPKGVSLKLEGDDEEYEIRQVNGAIHIDADDAQADLMACGGSEFRFNMDDGSIEMDEGRGSLHLDVDDGEAEIRNAAFESIDLDSDDGDFWIETSLANGGSYIFDMDDGDLELEILSGGGTFNIRHDNADISVGTGFRHTLDEENEDEYELSGGTAAVRIDVDDANIDLRKAN